MNTVQAAQDILASNPVVCDTETTGLEDHREVIEIAGVDSHGEELINKLVTPVGDFPYAVSKINNISGYELKQHGSQWGFVHIALREILDNFSFVAFNASFDVRLIEQTNHIQGEPPLFSPDSEVMIFDVMELANRHFHKHLEWDEKQSKFKCLSLAKCCEIAGIEFEGKAHRALVDAKATLALLKYIAEGGE